ncbi:ankyrin repeat-containing domain protein [Coprinopsis sp. MPI-PUGE-AT-0042]|nr:ankyrin repeat-containing domain protein [Coprinopsis sp. MPI-PUGE-AT-0042]
MVNGTGRVVSLLNLVLLPHISTIRTISMDEKRKRSPSPCQDVANKRWKGEVAAPPAECSPTASSSATISHVRNAQIYGGTFTGPGSTHNHTTIHNSNYGPQPVPFDVLEILNSQSLPKFRDIQQETLAKATEGTCIWFTRDEIFLFWISKGKILWGIGIPGAGKTILASIIIHDLERRAKASGGVMCLAYVYLRYSVSLAIRDVLESLVKQIVERHIDLITILEGLYAQHKQDRTKPSQQDLMGVLAEFVKRGKALFFVLDALDEMRAEDQPVLLRLLSSLDVKLFITSRPLDLLQRQYPQAQLFNIAASRSDIDLHIKDFLRHSPVVMALLEGNDFEKRIVETVHRKSGGMFLHVKLQLEALRHCVNALQVEETLERFPTDIGAIYEETWGRILAQGPNFSNLAKLILLWITHAHGEITVDTLRHVVATSPETHTFDTNRMVPEGLLQSVCCGLVSVDNKTRLVRLIHYTARDAILPRILDLYSVPHATLAHVCLTHLSKRGFPNLKYWEGGTGDEDSDFETVLSNDCLLAYAHRSWVHHSRQWRRYKPVMVALTELVLNSTTFPLENSDSWVDFGGPLHVAAFYGLEDLISPASQLQPPNATTAIHRRSPLMLAAHSGHLACAEALLSLPGIDINLGDLIGWNALMHAAYNGHIECMQRLVEVPDINVNAAGQEGWTAFICAVCKGNTEAVKVLLGLHDRVDINARDENGWTPLICAVRWGHIEVAKLLPGTPGIDINATDRDGWTALMHAAHLGRTEIVKQVLDAPGIDVNAVSTLVDDDDTSTRRLYLSKKDYNSKNNNKWTSLMMAARQGRTEIVKHLLDAPGIDVNVMSKPGGETALSQASRWGHREILDLLLAFPAIIVPASPDSL